MDLIAFRASLAGADPPQGLAPAAQALWWDGRGDWERAHACVQAAQDREAAWVHAYLHRKEGDLGNAGYWYRSARRPVAAGSLEEEWEALVRALA
jgi:hypothetical protein